MEVVSCCTGRAWRLSISATDEVARKSVSRVHEGRTPWMAANHGWRLEGPREYATDEDPLIEVAVNASAAAASVALTLGPREMRVRTATGTPPPGLRLATADEAVEAALRWSLGWGHMGCIQPDESAFWATRTQGRVYAADSVVDWRSRGLARPHGGLEGRLGIVLVYVGADIRLFELQRLAIAVEARHPDAIIGGGAFATDTPGARVLVVFADLRD